jgi:pimeloyl-ACP methyl ester carboxylesterase
VTELIALEPEPAPRPRHHYTEPAFMDVEGVPTAYRRKGSGAPVLFLHGVGFTRMWLPFYEAMSQRVDFVAPEHPGFGETPMPAWLRGIDDVVLHYDEFVQKLGIDRYHLVGFSLGGWLAAELAATYPRSIESLTLVAPLGLRVEWVNHPDIFQVGPEELMDRLFADKSKLAEVAPDPTSLDEIVHLYGESGTFARLAWTPRYNIALNRRLHRVTCPSQVILAEKDRLVPEAIGMAYAGSLPSCKTTRIPGTGHAMIVERPEETADVILSLVVGSAS